MNFLCDRCKQKYHVADEKVRGRAVTRFKCKKCEHVIELRMSGADGMPLNALPDDPSVAESPASIPPPPPAPTAAHPPRPGATSLPTRPATRPPTTTGSAPAVGRAPTGTGLPAAPRPGGSSAAASPLRATTNAPLPSRPHAQETPAPRRASIPPSPLLSGQAVRTASPPRPGAPRPATSTGLSTSAARAASPAGSPLGSALRSGLSGKSAAEPAPKSTAASALLNAAETGWYAGVRDLPVGPLTRNELAAKIEAGDITPDSLVWREGLDDWRPLRAVDELSDLVRAAAQRMSDGLLGTMGRREPAQSANKVVPIAPGRGAKGDVSPFAEDEDEPTRMTALSELIHTAEERGILGPQGSTPATTSAKPAAAPSATSSAKPAMTPAPSAAAPAATASAIPAATSAATQSAKPAVAPQTAPPATASVGPSPVKSPAAIAGPNEPTFNIDPAAAGLPYAPAPLQPAAASSAAPAVAAKPVPATPQRGLPPTVWIMMAGVLVTGVAVGLFLRPGSTPPATQPAPAVQPARVATPTAPEPPSGRQVGAEIHLGNEQPATPPTPPPVAPPPTPQPAAPDNVASTATTPATTTATTTSRSSTTAPAGTSTARTGTSAAAHAPPTGLSAAQLAALNAQLGTQSAGVAQSTGPTNTQLRNTPQTTDDSNGGLTGEARAGQIIATFRRATVVDSCWTAAQRRNPAHPSEAIRVALDVGPTGRATAVRVTGAQDPDLVACIQTRARAQPYGAGGSVSTEVSFNLVPGQ